MLVRNKEIVAAFKLSIPVMMGYVVIGFAFGLLFVSAGYAWYLALLMSVVVYAGALQYLAISLISANAGYLDTAVASLLVNVRQAFYGLSLLRKFRHTGAFKPYLIFALTDETYALLTTLKEDKTLSMRHFYLYLSMLNQSYWVAGTLIGALTAGFVEFETAGLDYALTALFIVLALEQYRQLRKTLPFLIGAVAAVAALVVLPSEKMLLGAILLSLVCLFMSRRWLRHSAVANV